MTDEEAATRLFMAISDDELFQKMQQSGACIGDLLFIEALVKAIKILGERKHPDATTGLVSCGCGGSAILCLSFGSHDDITGSQSFGINAECHECHISTSVCSGSIKDGDSMEEYESIVVSDWNRAMGYGER